ncbi:zinc finger CCCH domain-containing protein 56-like [Phoenix dactylifera]|nr:zinc finger CCCH domain-containing protein 56-like [Phoenix dactylifera]
MIAAPEGMEPREEHQMVAAQERMEPREEHQIPILTSSSSDPKYKRRHCKKFYCKKFYTEEGCPYGDTCTFLHDEQSKARESVAISLSPTVGGGGYDGGPNASNQRPSSWKTRICNKWEVAGYCPYGSKCHFAHGAAELHRYGGGLVEMEGRDASSVATDSNQAGASTRAPADTVVASMTSVPHADVYHRRGPSQRSTVVGQRQGLGQGQRVRKSKWPDKIKGIYGDWIDESE